MYKPNYNNYSLSCKSNSEYINTAVATNVSNQPNSISSNSGNPSEVFFRGTDNYVWVARKTGNQWTTEQLQFNDGPPSPIATDVKYLPLHDVLLYAGTNQRINLFGRSSVEPCGFYHWYLRSDWWVGNYDKISTSPGSLQTTPNGEIFFRGIDNNLHRYYHNGSIWIHELLPHPTNIYTKVKGDIVVDPVNMSVFYKGADDRIQCFYKNGSGNYVHAWIDAATNPKSWRVKSSTTSIAWAASLNGLVYLGDNSKVHTYTYNGSSWAHNEIPYTYGSPSLGYGNGDYALNSIQWHDEYQRLYYTGRDGRVQLFDYSPNSWWHWWVDDYWNTDEYNSYHSTAPSSYSSSISMGADAPNRSIFYTSGAGHLRYFKYEPCERLNPVVTSDHSTWLHLNKIVADSQAASPNAQANTLATPKLQNDVELSVYPNPTADLLQIRASSSETATQLITVRNVLGQIILSKQLQGKAGNIDVSSLPTGSYLLEASDGNHHLRTRFYKN